MNCVHCRGKMKRGTTPFYVHRKGCHLMLDDVPAWICQQCGEVYFDEREVDALQKIIASLEKKTEELLGVA